MAPYSNVGFFLSESFFYLLMVWNLLKKRLLLFTCSSKMADEKWSVTSEVARLLQQANAMLSTVNASSGSSSGLISTESNSLARPNAVAVSTSCTTNSTSSQQTSITWRQAATADF